MSSCTWQGWLLHTQHTTDHRPRFISPQNNLEIHVTTRMAQAPPSRGARETDNNRKCSLESESSRCRTGPCFSTLLPGDTRPLATEARRMRRDHHMKPHIPKSRGRASANPPEDTLPWSVAKIQPVQRSAAQGTARLPATRHLQERPASAHREGGRRAGTAPPSAAWPSAGHSWGVPSRRERDADTWGATHATAGPPAPPDPPSLGVAASFAGLCDCPSRLARSRAGPSPPGGVLCDPGPSQPPSPPFPPNN